MANVTVKPDVTETRVIEKGGVTLELSTEEANNLALLLRGGVGSGTIGLLGLRTLVANLTAEGLGEENPNNWRKWTATAQRSSL